MTLFYDLIFAGNLVLDEVHPFAAPVQHFCGGPVQFSAAAASWSTKRIAVVTKAGEKDARDARCLDGLRGKGIAVHVELSPETTAHRVSHLTDQVDEREMVLLTSAGRYSVDDFGEFEPTRLHLAALNDQEFSLDLVRELSRRGFVVSVDMQGFVRRVDPRTGHTELSDVEGKREIAVLTEKLKLDVVEGERLTGTTDVERAAIQFESWGAREVMVTRADGVLVRHAGRTYFERFSNQNVSGRTGRGDTTFGAYLTRRLEHDVPESLKFAAALASIKMESPGPFAGTLEDVLARMNGT